MRLKAGATTFAPLDSAPAHANALYISAGVVVAAQVWDQRGDPELDSVGSVSPDQGSTWIPVPPPA